MFINVNEQNIPFHNPIRFRNDFIRNVKCVRMLFTQKHQIAAAFSDISDAHLCLSFLDIAIDFGLLWRVDGDTL